MFGNIAHAVRQIKSDVASAFDATVVVRLCHELGHRWRERELDPVTTVRGFLLQVLHGNTACSHVPHLLGKKVSAEAYGLARARLPVALFERLLGEVCHGLESCVAESAGWCGHRVWTMDGSSCSMPDTPELQAAFGQPGQQEPGCGFPVAHLLTLFHAGTGLLLRVVTAPLRTHDMAQASVLHRELEPGDIVLADRGFCSYAHLALLLQAGAQAVFRLHQRQIVSFRIGRMHVPPSPPFRKLKAAEGLPRSRWIRWLGRLDQHVEYFKPKECPEWMSREAYAALPRSLTVRELRYQVGAAGCRTREVTLVTTLLDSDRYTADALAELYGQRWQIETNLRHLKQTLGMDVLRTKSVAGVHKELAMFALVYNLVRLVMLRAAERQGVPPDRISFVDAMRWLRHVRPGQQLPDLELVPHRPGRYEPRVRKRRPKEYDLMNKPREALREALYRKRLTA
jgi:multisubunit Na+/H+ antiporter MnhG subunit